MTATSSNRGRWYALLFICISLLVISLDNTILNVALPAISRELGASSSELQWIVDAYVLVFAALLLTTGSTGDRYGRKRALQVGLVWFGAGSLAAALSTSTEMLIAARAFLGVGGAIIMPATLSIVTATFTDHKERSRAIGLWAAVFGLGVGLGPVIGGWLLERFHWNSVFFVNLPVVVIALIGGYFFIGESRDEHAPAADIPGVILSITGLFSLIYGIIEAGIEGWTADNVLAAFAIAAVLLISFGVWEAYTKTPMLPVRFFRNMSFTGANTALALATFSLFGSMFFISQYFQSVQGYTALEAGVRTMPMALFLMFASANSARVAERLGLKLAVALGLAISAGGLLYFSVIAQPDTDYLVNLFGLCIIGIGLGMAMPPATDSIMASIPVQKAGVGSAMNDTTRQLGGALGVAVLGTFMNDVYLSKIAALDQLPALANVPEAAREAISSSIQGAHAVAAQLNAGQLSDLIRNTANSAFVDGMTQAMLVGAVIMFASALVTIAILPNEVRRFEEEPESLPEDGYTERIPEVQPAFGD